MPTMRRRGARWSMVAAAERLGIEHGQPYDTGFPDTEVNLGLQLAEWGVKRWDAGTERPEGLAWLCLGPEPNDPYENADLVHVRSYSGMRLYGTLEQSRASMLARAMVDARRRVAEWRNPPLPSLGQQAANFAGAVARHVAGGMQRVTPEQAAERLKICDRCPDLRTDGRCAKCGCGVALKTAWAQERCPAGKW